MDNIRQQFGNRFLDESSDVFQHNAWDNVEWDEEQEKLAQDSVDTNSKVKIDDEKGEKIKSNLQEFSYFSSKF